MDSDYSMGRPDSSHESMKMILLLSRTQCAPPQVRGSPLAHGAKIRVPEIMIRLKEKIFWNQMLA
jgi:hypothetical protein